MAIKQPNYVPYTINHDITINGDLIASGTLVAIGDTTISGNLMVTGSSNAVIGFTTVGDTSLGDSDADTVNISGTLSVMQSGTSSLFVSGNKVGIGTTSPTALLNVSGASAGLPIATFEDGSADTYLAIKTDAAKNSILSFDDDTTRMGEVNYDHNINSMGLWTSGTEKVIIDQNGNVGIGRAPTRALDVFTGASAGEAELATDATSDSFWKFTTDTDGTPRAGYVGMEYATNTMRVSHTTLGTLNGLAVDSSGRVGLGTATPIDVLTIKHATTPVLRIENTAGDIWRIGEGVGTSERLSFRSSGLNADTLTMSNTGAVGIGMINPVAYLDISGNDINPSLHVRTKDDGNALVVTSGGNVGIGTASPGVKLHIYEDSTNFEAIKLSNAVAGGGGTTETVELVFQQAASNVGGKILSGRESNYSSAAARDSYLAFETATSNSDTEKMRITSSGNVGIGTTSPADTLDVRGNTYISGTLTISGLATSQLKLPLSNDATTPTLAFGDGDSGFYEASDDVINAAFAGVSQWTWQATLFESNSTDGPVLMNENASSTNPVFAFSSDQNTGMGRAGADVIALIAGGQNVFNIDTAGMYASTAGGGKFLDQASTATVPSFVPDYADTNTGIGHNATDELSLIAGGKEILRLTSGLTPTVHMPTNNRWITGTGSDTSTVINMFKVNPDDEIEVGGTLNIGTFEFTEDSGPVTWANMPVSSSSPAGSEMSYGMSIDSTPIAKVYAESDGTGGIQNAMFKTISGLQLDALPTADPSVAGQLFRAGSVLYISLG